MQGFYLNQKGVRPTDNTPESRYARLQAVQWIARLLDRNIELSDAFFECVEWCCGGLDFCVQALGKEILKPGGTRSAEILSRHYEELLEVTPSRRSGAFGDFVDTHPEYSRFLSLLVQDQCRAISRVSRKKPRAFARAAEHLQYIFGLDEESVDFCEFLFMNRTFRSVERYFEDDLKVFGFGAKDFMAYMLGMSTSKCRQIIQQLINLGVTENKNGCVVLTDSIKDFWDEADPRKISESFCAPLKGEVLPLESFNIPEEYIAHVQDLLQQPGDSPVHILLYGAPGTGKTTFARSLAAASGLSAWAVNAPQNADQDRRAQLMAGVGVVSRHEKAFLLVDEAERLLDCDMFAAFRQNTTDKAWLNSFMEKPGQRIIWVTNHVHHLEEAVLRRFHFSIQFEPLGRKERSRMWRQILERYGVLNRVDESSLKELARTYDVPASVIEMAVDQAKSLCKRKQKGFVQALKRVVASYALLKAGGEKPRRKKTVASNYDPQGVTLEGSVQELEKKLVRGDSLLRRGEDIGAGAFTMLFYGPPGTGKTALARYLADKLDRECMVVRASDLLAPYVGMTERLIAKAFADAEREGAVLVIDEADSFLFSRDMATRSWETTQVNEFLTALEECRGICVCTTNRRELMDPAVMRRFSHKVSFGYAKFEQAKALYSSMLAPMVGTTLPATLEASLVIMKKLTPGDFHAVRAQMRHAEDTVTHEDLIRALKREQELKLDSQGGGMGFI